MENLPEEFENASPKENTDANNASLPIGKDSKAKKEVKIDRTKDFTHTHPNHAKHKNFGFDHEPGAF